MPNTVVEDGAEEAVGTMADAARLSEMFDATGHRGPYHIINTNLVLVNSPNRRRRTRGGDSFILSPLYCGGEATGWCKTKDFMDDGMTLSTAMATSGAAANPNTGVGGVGVTRSPLVSALMAFFTIRLGYWAGHPRVSAGSTPHSPNHFRPGLYDALGGYHENSPFIHLSDGGHFENLAIYELIRRRVRLIICCDGGADANFKFNDLANAINRAEVDFGARITFREQNALSSMTPSQPADFPRQSLVSERGFLVGDIRYRNGDEGTLILLKTTMIAGLPLAVQRYKATHSEFPDQSTADQFFDEGQFEAYRQLGYHIADCMAKDLDLNKLIADLEA